MLDRRLQRPGTPGVILRRIYKDVNENHIQKYFAEYPELLPYWAPPPIRSSGSPTSRGCASGMPRISRRSISRSGDRSGTTSSLTRRSSSRNAS